MSEMFLFSPVTRPLLDGLGQCQRFDVHGERTAMSVCLYTSFMRWLILLVDLI